MGTGGFVSYCKYPRHWFGSHVARLIRGIVRDAGFCSVMEIVSGRNPYVDEV